MNSLRQKLSTWLLLKSPTLQEGTVQAEKFNRTIYWESQRKPHGATRYDKKTSHYEAFVVLTAKKVGSILFVSKA